MISPSSLALCDGSRLRSGLFRPQSSRFFNLDPLQMLRVHTLHLHFEPTLQFGCPLEVKISRERIVNRPRDAQLGLVVFLFEFGGRPRARLGTEGLEYFEYRENST